MRCRSRARESRAGIRHPARADRRSAVAPQDQGYRTIVRIQTYDRSYSLKDRSRHVHRTLARRRCGADRRVDRPAMGCRPRPSAVRARLGAAPDRCMPTTRRCGGPTARACASPESTGPVRMSRCTSGDARTARWSCSPTAGTGGPVNSRHWRENSSVRGTTSSLSTHRRTATRPAAPRTSSTGSTPSARSRSAMAGSAPSSGTRSVDLARSSAPRAASPSTGSSPSRRPPTPTCFSRSSR